MHHRLKLLTQNVIREGTDSPVSLLNDAHSVATLAFHLVSRHEDDKERFWIVLVDEERRYLMHTEITLGAQTGSVVHPREVFGPALREGAEGICLVHNHPSGDPEPSEEDLELTKRLAQGGELLGVSVLDHVIVGDGSGAFVSLRERGVFPS